VLNRVDYYIPKVGDFSGKIRIVAIFIKNLPADVQADLMGNDVLSLLSLRLVLQRDFADEAAKLL
jgi:hypothetical protein